MHTTAPTGAALPPPPLKCYGEHVTVAIWLKNLHPVRVVLMALIETQTVSSVDTSVHVALSCGESS